MTVTTVNDAPVITLGTTFVGELAVAPPVNVAAGMNYPTSIVVADFTGDGRGDIAMTSSAGIVLLPATGGGAFGAPITHAASSPGDLAAADFNQDGYADLVTADFIQDGSLTIRWGNPAGTLTSTSTIPTTVAPLTVATGDLNGDGWVDIVAGPVMFHRRCPEQREWRLPPRGFHQLWLLQNHSNRGQERRWSARRIRVGQGRGVLRHLLNLGGGALALASIVISSVSTVLPVLR